MPRTTLTKTTAPGKYSTTGTTVTMTAADTSNQNDYDSVDDAVIIAHNTSGSTAYTVTITSQPDSKTGRSGNVSAVSLAANEIRVFRPGKDGWDNSGKTELEANNAAIEFGIVVLRDDS